MNALITEYGSWVLSLVTLAVTFGVGSKGRQAWLWYLVTQSMWMVWIAASRNWGFMPLTIGLIVLSVYNHWKWTRQGDASSEDDLRLGWIVADAQGLRFRRWGDSGPEWTERAEDALHFSRRWPDAERFCAEDEDAWKIIRHAYLPSMAEIESRRTASVYVL